jgi:PII-like signaling protein
MGVGMNGILLRFYVHETRKHRHILLYDWLLEKAKKLGIHGGSVFRAIAGYGRHGVLHEEHFFELASDLTVEIDFAVTEAEAAALLDVIRGEGIAIFYVKIPIDFGTTGDAAAGDRVRKPA